MTFQYSLAANRRSDVVLDDLDDLWRFHIVPVSEGDRTTLQDRKQNASSSCNIFHKVYDSYKSTLRANDYMERLTLRYYMSTNNLKPADMAKKIGRSRQNIEQWMANMAIIEVFEDGRFKISTEKVVHETQVKR